MHKRKVIIDTDPGIDDLLAISVALASDEIDVIAISTVHGNVNLDTTTKNAKLICDIFNRKINIIKGSEKPLFYNKKASSIVHALDGIGGLYEKYRNKVNQLNSELIGIDKLRQLIKESKEKVTIIALGPLTNIAALLLTDETIKDNIEEIHIMGGGFAMGNVNELVEFNFFSDSYAAQVVFNSNIKIYLSPLNVTSKVYFSNEEFARLNDNSNILKFIKDSVEFYIRLDPYLHDVVSVMTLLRPNLFTYKKIGVKVISDPGVADGMTYFANENSENNVYLADSDQRENIIGFILNTLNKLN